MEDKKKENENEMDFKEEIIILDRPLVLKNQPKNKFQTKNIIRKKKGFSKNFF